MLTSMTKVALALVCSFVFAVGCARGQSGTQVTFFVATNGNDAWSGRLPAPNAGNTDGPFATLDHARAAVRALNKTGLTQITVQFRAGTYYLPATELFTAADSGTATLNIVYQNFPGETPIFSGGVRVQNWTNTGNNNVWQTTLPASTKYFEDFYYNGTRRLRPRVGGNLGTYLRFSSTSSVYLNAPPPPAPTPEPNCSIYVPGNGWECFDRFHYDEQVAPIVSTWRNLAPPANNPCGQPAGNPALVGDIELLDWEQFSTSKLRINCVDTTNHLVYLTGATGVSPNNPKRDGFIAGNRYLVENVQDLLTQPGQWFLDRSTTPWTLKYLANTVENPNLDNVIIPQLTQILVTSNLQYVTFQGLTFTHDNYTLPDGGHSSDELEPTVSAAISIQNSQHITFDSGVVTQISGVGLEIISCLNGASPPWCVSSSTSATTANDTISNSAFYDLGALGIRIGDPRVGADTDANVPQSILVQNNVVEGYGRTIPAAFGIGQGEGHDNIYTHNDVYDGYHCAISISEATGDTTKPNGMGNANNTISFNHVYNLLQGIMNDGGSIRIESGNQVFTAAGNKILNNKIHDVTDASALDPNGYGGNGIYLDNQTGLVDVENNLVYRVSGNAVHTPQGPAAPNEASLIKNNILAFAGQSMVAELNPYQNGVPSVANLAYVISNNIFYFDGSSASSPKFFVQGGCVYSGGFPYPQYQQWNKNLYWRTDGSFATDNKAFYVQPAAGNGPDAPCSGDAKQYTFYSFAGWQQNVGEDLQSVVQDPGFKNPTYPTDDFSLPKGSPGVGFVVFDPNQDGRSNPVIHPPAILATFPTKPAIPLPTPLPTPTPNPSSIRLTYTNSSSVKLEQVIGDCDFQAQAQQIVKAQPVTCGVPTTSQTVTRFNIAGNGQGGSFEANGRMIFFFGDTISTNPSVVNYHAHDPIAQSTSTDPEKGLLLNFYTQSDGSPLFVEPPGVAMAGDDIPNAGIYVNGQIYFIVNTGSDPSLPNPQGGDFSVLVQFNEAAQTFTTGRTISPVGGHFIGTSLHESGGYVYLFGAGPYRASDVYLQRVPDANFASGTGTEYFAGLDVMGQPRWVNSESGLVPVVQDNPLNGPVWPNDNPTVGNVSVIYSSALNLWFMTYDGGRQSSSTTGTYFSYAPQPWGPWATPQLIFNRKRDRAYGLGGYIHDPSVVPDPPGDGLNGPTIGSNDIYTTAGGEFAPLMIERFTRVSGSTLDIYYNISTWNPYTIVRMRSEFAIATPGNNPIDQADFFVRQHYYDFLNRPPDASGLAFWENQITSCGTDQSCIDARRVNTSGAFFLSIEFQQTGYLVERTYKVAFGDGHGVSTIGGTHQLSVPIINFNQFIPDTAEIGQGVVVGQTGWETVLENNKQAYFSDFVQRARFKTAFPNALTPAQFVDGLFANAGVTPVASDRTAAINEFGSATTTTDAAARGRAVRRVAENATLNTQEFNRAFVLMQYFGYLRRDPNSGPDTDWSGYDFWLTKLNQFNGNFINAEMVKAFLTSIEYRQRFGP
jgi:Domain of unknown function (DUF4185)